jgi:hypothetical protein
MSSKRKKRNLLKKKLGQWKKHSGRLKACAALLSGDFEMAIKPVENAGRIIS